MNAQNQPWSIILAGGEGERIRPLVQAWLGVYRPNNIVRLWGPGPCFSIRSTGLPN